MNMEHKQENITESRRYTVWRDSAHAGKWQWERGWWDSKPQPVGTLAANAIRDLAFGSLRASAGRRRVAHLCSRFLAEQRARRLSRATVDALADHTLHALWLQPLLEGKKRRGRAEFPFFCWSGNGADPMETAIVLSAVFGESSGALRLCTSCRKPFAVGPSQRHQRKCGDCSGEWGTRL